MSHVGSKQEKFRVARNEIDNIEYQSLFNVEMLWMSSISPVESRQRSTINWNNAMNKCG